MLSSTRTRGAASHSEALLPARILAIDYGRRRMGLALSDELGVMAQTLPVIVRTNRREDLRRLRQVVKEKHVAAVVIGSPIHLSGRTSEMAEEAARFAAHLKKELRLPVVLRDERLTSWEAQEMAAELGLDKDAAIDSIAAAILLREYLEEARALRKSKASGS